MYRMDSESNQLCWFEIPVKDMARARKFYETIFEIQMEELPELLEIERVGFPGSGKTIRGVLAFSPIHKPSLDGSLLYLNANPELGKVVDRVEKAGGKILLPRTELGAGLGFMAYMMDSEGNAIALHALN